MKATIPRKTKCTVSQQRVVRFPCAKCPFRADSPLSYDADAITALEDGNEPACHSIVGRDVIFEDWNPDESKRCLGYELWLNDTPGFGKPTDKQRENARTTTLQTINFTKHNMKATIDLYRPDRADADETGYVQGTIEYTMDPDEVIEIEDVYITPKGWYSELDPTEKVPLTYSERSWAVAMCVAAYAKEEREP